MTDLAMLQHMPAKLVDLPQWVAWAEDKTPIDPKNGKKAKANDPKTWGSLAEATRRCVSDGLVGVGFEFAADGEFVGIDLDNVRNPDTGELDPIAERVIEEIDSYTEVSPSGTGAHIIAIAGQVERGRKRNLPGGRRLEIYSSGRYFTMTGEIIGDHESINDRQGEVKSFYKWLTRQGKDKKKPTKKNGGQHACSSKKMRRASAYLAKMDPAIEGKNGHDSALVAAIAMRKGFELPPEVARQLLWDEYNPRCIPMWDEAHKHDLMRKVDEAEKDTLHEWGYLLNKDRKKEDDEANMVPIGTRDPESGKWVFSPSKTLHTARAFEVEFARHDGVRRLQYWGGTFWSWRDNQYVEIEDGMIRHRIFPWLTDAKQYKLNGRTKALELVDYDACAKTVSGALIAVKDHMYLKSSIQPGEWIRRLDGDPDPSELVMFKTGSLHLVSGDVFPPTPRLFNHSALDFDYSPDAQKPIKWFAFLSQILPNDSKAIMMIQEWFGYCLVIDTSLQKSMLLVGPPRAGKGIICKILTKLVGVGNVCSPTARSLAGAFGLQQLMGKSLAVLADARFTGEFGAALAEILLPITGEDSIAVDRKYLPSITLRLPVRFVVATNEVPRLSDASGALASRWLVVQLTQTFIGRENLNLLNELSEELPGILLWAIDGWKRLKERGSFIQPASSEEARESLKDLGSPVAAFVRDKCTVGSPSYRASISSLYEAWRLWCIDSGRKTISTKQRFCRDLRAAFPALKKIRSTLGSDYEGIGLSSAPVAEDPVTEEPEKRGWYR